MHRARKRFGQHFLHDPGVIARIVAAIDPQPDDRMVEIGPGLGAITAPLLDRLRELHAVEIDRDAIRHLQAMNPGRGVLHLHEADVLTFDLQRLSGAGSPVGPGCTRHVHVPRPAGSEAAQNGDPAVLSAGQGAVRMNSDPQDIAGRLRLVGNLPYNISTPLLFRLIEQRAHVLDMHFMLQKEVVARMAATPGSDDYGRLTVMLAPWLQIEPLFDIGPGAFRPPPRVTSTFVRMRPHAAPPLHIADPQRYAAVVAAAFSQRRKTLRNALKALLNVEEIAAAGIDPGLRAEVIAPAGFAALAEQRRSSQGAALP